MCIFLIIVVGTESWQHMLVFVIFLRQLIDEQIILREGWPEINIDANFAVINHRYIRGMPERVGTTSTPLATLP